jgi:hypothetical protein
MAYEKWVYAGFAERLLSDMTSIRTVTTKMAKAGFLLIVDWAELKENTKL